MWMMRLAIPMNIMCLYSGLGELRKRIMEKVKFTFKKQKTPVITEVFCLII
jgi:hypothetical protein